MARRDVPVKKYAVRQSEDERRRLKELVLNGKSPAKRLLKARILLKADVSELDFIETAQNEFFGITCPCSG